MPRRRTRRTSSQTLHELIESLDSVTEIGSDVNSADIDTRERVARLTSWEKEDDFKRNLRKLFAPVLLVVLIGQIVVVNVFVFLLGHGELSVSNPIATAYIGATVAEIAGLVLIVIRYLFATEEQPD